MNRCLYTLFHPAQALRLDVSSQTVQLGNVRLGSSLSKGVKITNATKKTLRLALKLSSGLLPAPSPAAAASAAALVEAQDDRANALGVTFVPHPTPGLPLELRPRQTIEMTVRSMCIPF